MPEQSTRDAVAEAFDKLAGSETTAVEPAGDAGAKGEAAVQIAPERASAGVSRDAAGRFAAKGGKEPAGPEKSGAPAVATDAGQGAAPAGSPPPAAAPVLPELKLPADWRAEAREKLKTSPREVQEEAIRLHIETKKALQRASDLERDIEPWRTATQPYAHVFAGAPPHQVIGNLLRSLSVLQTGHPQQRAQVAAAIVRDYLGTDEGALTLLAQALDKSGPSQPAPQPKQLGPQDLDAWYEQRRNGEARDAAVKTWKDFETANSEFLNEPGFRQRIAVELQMAMAEMPPGAQPTREDIQKAYDAACGTHPGVAKIVNQRKEVEAAAKANASTQTSAAAASVRNEPAGPNGAGKSKNTRDEVARQWERAERSRV